MTDTEMNDVFPGPLIEPHDLSQLQYHITLCDFGEKVQKAANAAYPNDENIKYPRVYALLLLWEDEDPYLPVSQEVHELGIVLASIYNFEVETYLIPSEGSHKKLNQKILDFVELGGDSAEHLKIVYYGGHGMLAHNRQPDWVSRSDPRDPSFRTVKWGGIQNSLEQAKSDVLLLLDCCSSGTANTGDGCGTTELIAACGFNNFANGVGRHSFTHALTTELRLLSSYPKFTAAVLYNRILCRLQNWMPEGRELQKAPLHVVLTQNQALPSSIQLSVTPKPKPESMTLQSPLQSLGSPSPNSFASNERTDSDQDSDSSPISSLLSADEQFPRILLSVRLKEDMVPELSADLFSEWLRMMPVVANSITVEAGFSSFSTLILVSMPTPIWVCLGKNPAFNLVGIIKKKPDIKIISTPTFSPLEVAEIDNYHSLKTKQLPTINSLKTRSSEWLNMQTNQTPTTPLFGSLFDHRAPILRYHCHYIGCNKFFKRRTDCVRHTKKHQALFRSTPPPSLAMFETRETFMEHLHIDPETYELMEKETETIYRKLISEQNNLKHGGEKVFYKWDEFDENSKNQAMELLCKGGTDQTSDYWNLARPTSECPNWIARWFLYHAFSAREEMNKQVTWPSDLSQ
ncbi:hypothetical protein ACHAO1_010337 [Botrytis cinerea]